jgi:hypothetical protein
MSIQSDECEIIVPRNETEKQLRDFSEESIPFTEFDYFSAELPKDDVNVLPSDYDNSLGTTGDFVNERPTVSHSQQTTATYGFSGYNQQNNSSSQERIYLKVPYAEKDEAKSLGARWDSGSRKWYITSNLDQELFKKWQ